MRTHICRENLFRTVLYLLTALNILAHTTGAAQSSELVTPEPPRDESMRSRSPQPLQAPARDATAKRQLASSNPGSLSFLPAVNYDSGGRSDFSLAVGDLNGDGKPDVVATNCTVSFTACSNGSRGFLGVLLGNGDGTLRAAVAYDSGGYRADYVAIADVNGDGKLDILVSNLCGPPCGGHGSVGVLLGNGDGTFQSAVTFDSGDAAAYSVTVADLNGDGKPDLLMVNSGSVAVLLGNGDGTFQTAVTYPFTGSYIYSFAVADVNGDGKLDILSLVQNLGSNSINMFMGNGDGTFQLPVTLLPDFAVWSVALADVNGDGKPDLLMTNSQIDVGEVGVALGNGDGTFRSAVTFGSGGASPNRVAVGDFNGDGKADLAVTNSGSGISNTNNIAVLLGNGEGSFLSATSYAPGGGGTSAVTVADLNGDGKPDILFTNIYGTGGSSDGSVGVLLNSTTLGKAGTSTSLTSSLNPSIYGQKVTWTATVTSSGSITPTGKVRFTWSGYKIGAATLNSAGVASLTKSNLNADSYPLTAVYVGDAANLGSTSAVLNQVVSQTTSSATLSSSPNPSTQGQAVTFTATISSPTVVPTGPVTFTVGKTVLGTAQLSGGKGKFTISMLAVGSTNVTATYYGNSNIAKSSASVTQTVH